jgi:phosphoesterase RecJ-like protein
LTGHPVEPWFLDRLRAARKPILMTHVDPDADGLGSQVAFFEAARAVGVDALIINDDPIPRRFAWVDPAACVADYDQRSADLEGADLGLIFDAHDVSRAGRPAQMLQQAGVEILVVDHHPVPEGRDVSGLVAVDFSSTGELCYRLLETLGWPVSSRAAHALYGAISFDTGSFRFLRNQPETLRVAAELIERGIDTNPIQEALFASRPLAETHLLGRILSHIEISAGGRVASVTVEPAMLRDLDVPPDASGEAIPMVIGIEGVLVAAMFKPGRKPGQWKVSLRSKTEAKIGHIAIALGGGGHDHAAGATIEGDIEVLRPQILAQLAAVVGEA